MKRTAVNLGMIQVPEARPVVPTELSLVPRLEPLRRADAFVAAWNGTATLEADETLDPVARPCTARDLLRSLATQDGVGRRISERAGDLVLAGYTVHEARSLADTPGERLAQEMYATCAEQIEQGLVAYVDASTGPAAVAKGFEVLRSWLAHSVCRMSSTQIAQLPAIDLTRSIALIPSTRRSTRRFPAAARRQYDERHGTCNQYDADMYSTYLTDAEIKRAIDDDAIPAALDTGKQRWLQGSDSAGLFDPAYQTQVCRKLLAWEMSKVMESCAPAGTDAQRLAFRLANAVRDAELRLDMGCLAAISASPQGRWDAEYAAVHGSWQARRVAAMTNLELAAHLGRADRTRRLLAAGIHPMRDVDLVNPSVTARPHPRL